MRIFLFKGLPVAPAAASPVADTPDQLRDVVAASIEASRRIANESRLKFD